jgi:hypothetical protein
VKAKTETLHSVETKLGWQGHEDWKLLHKFSTSPETGLNLKAADKGDRALLYRKHHLRLVF